MSLKRKVRTRAVQRARRVRARLTIARRGAPHEAAPAVYRVSVFRSLKHMYAQIIDDAVHATLVSCSSREVAPVAGSDNKKEVAGRVGKELARRAHEKGIVKVVFDRGSFLFHGRVKALADGLRAGGLEF